MTLPTAVPSVLNSGGLGPDCMSGIACHVMIDVPIAFHVTPLSVTVLPKIVGHVGSVAAELPAAGCTASYRKFEMGDGVSKFQDTRPTYPMLRLDVPLPAPIPTRTCAAFAGALPVIDINTVLYPSC